MENNAKYSIILTMKKFYSPLDWIFYFCDNFALFFKFFIYSLLKNKKSEKYKRQLFDSITFTQIDGKKYPIIGHRQLQESLYRGFLDNKIPFKIDELSKNLILMWVDKTDLRVLKRLKKKGKFSHALTVPTACKYDYIDLMWNFPLYDSIDASLVASLWVKEKNEQKIPKEYHNKIKVWASGVKLPSKKEKKLFESCICYYKRLEINEELTKFLEENGIKTEILEYGKYKHEDYLKMLQRNDFVIFYQDLRETQGLAILEAWSYDLPVFVKKSNPDFFPSPYLEKQNGLPFSSLEELKEIILRYKKDSLNFLNQFSSYEYVKNNMNDKISVLNLMKIFEELDK